MFDWLKKVVNRGSAESKLHTAPITLNAPEGVQLQRALGRLLNLYNVKNKDAGIYHEIARFKLAIQQHGYAPPNNFTETEDLIRLTRG